MNPARCPVLLQERKGAPPHTPSCKCLLAIVDIFDEGSPSVSKAKFMFLLEYMS
nr:hypothetical protein [uncultured organism]